MKTSELTGALLDLWVARAEGQKVFAYRTPDGVLDHLVTAHMSFGNGKYAPSTDWAQGGPIIDREKIALKFDATSWDAQTQGDDWIYAAPTSLVAAMRAYVASKFGDTVPDEVAA